MPSAPPLEIIAPTQPELRAIAALYRECFNAPDKGENWTEASAYAYFQERIEEGSVFAVLRDAGQQIIGVCCGSPFATSFLSREISGDYADSFYLSLVALSPKARGKGYASRMVSEYCTAIKQQGFPRILVRCRSSNSAIQHVLTKQKFEEIGRYSSELGGVTCERLLLLRHA